MGVKPQPAVKTTGCPRPAPTAITVPLSPIGGSASPCWVQTLEVLAARSGSAFSRDLLMLQKVLSWQLRGMTPLALPVLPLRATLQWCWRTLAGT